MKIKLVVFHGFYQINQFFVYQIRKNISNYFVIQIGISNFMLRSYLIAKVDQVIGIDIAELLSTFLIQFPSHILLKFFFNFFSPLKIPQ